MIGGPGDSRYVRKKTGPVGFDENSLAYGQKKRSLSESAVFHFDRLVSFVAAPRTFIRDHRNFMRLLKGELKDDEKVEDIAKTLTERKVAVHFSSEDIQKGLKKLRARQLKDRGLTERMDVDNEFDRSRAVLLQEEGRDLKMETGQAWSATEERPAQEKIKAQMQQEYAVRDARKEELKSGYDSQFGEEDEEILRLKEAVAEQRVMVDKWQHRLKKLPWYSSKEKKAHFAFEKIEEYNQPMDRDGIRQGLYNAEVELYQRRMALNEKTDPLRQRHDQTRYLPEQMKLVNGHLSGLLTGIQESQRMDFELKSPEYKASSSRKAEMEEVYRTKVDWRTTEFRERTTFLADGLAALENNKITQEQLADFYNDYPELDPRGSTDDDPAVDLKHGRMVLTSRMVAGNAMFRMQNMTTSSKEYEASVEAYLAGKPDPMELKLMAEAEKMSAKQRESRASKLLNWIFSDDEDYSGDESYPVKPVTSKQKASVASTVNPLPVKETSNDDLLLDITDSTASGAPTSPITSAPSDPFSMGPSTGDKTSLLDSDLAFLSEDPNKNNSNSN